LPVVSNPITPAGRPLSSLIIRTLLFGTQATATY
jgi:hypothetical protein